jgi:hypothetical protein
MVHDELQKEEEDDDVVVIQPKKDVGTDSEGDGDEKTEVVGWSRERCHRSLRRSEPGLTTEGTEEHRGSQPSLRSGGRTKASAPTQTLEWFIP